ncbi:uncharacterized protein LOC132201269 isoform X2 [Neocloeon triangulifer]|nr:uncharacterized protein LOC132201269 isoform X2 [Neocloeon triangulifer]
MDSTAILNPIEEVKKLQEMVRQLERQNEELRKGGPSGGLGEMQAARRSASVDSLVALGDDCSDTEQTWLFRSSQFDAAASDPDLDLWLLQLRRQLDREQQQLQRNAAAADAEDVAPKQLTEQRQFDTRTFTRPKKRLLPLSVAKSMNSSRNSSQENLLMEQHSRQPRESSLPRHNLDSTFQLHRAEGRSTPDRLSNGRLTPSGLPRRSVESQLNRTFNLDQSHHNDHLEEDQISSASDSSFSSSHRAALTAGEVKTLARMQEESLKYSSTPYHIESRVLSPDLPSPITRSTEDFQSDHSSRSSMVGDSLHSSPSGSPYGSNQALTKVPDGMLIGSNETLDRPPRLLKQRVEVSGLARPVLNGRSRGSSLIKPQCLVRPVISSGESGIPRPQGVSRISRIPAPRTRL